MRPRPAFRRTRLAPTPSGYIHLGNLASFILTCYLARENGAAILLRIDDLDHSRYRQAYLDDIFETLKFMQLPWDEGPQNAEEFNRAFSQRTRMHLYEKGLEYLSHSTQLFACDCSRKHIKHFSDEEGYPGICLHKGISLDTPETSWRLSGNDQTPLRMQIVDGQIIEGVLPSGKRFLQVRKKDGTPTYQLSSVVDDIHFGVDMIVRGADLLDSSWAQLYLSGLLPENEFSNIHFLHHPLILTTQGTKLSKSAGDTSIHALIKAGKTPREVLHYLGAAIGADRGVDRWEDLGEWMVDCWLT